MSKHIVLESQNFRIARSGITGTASCAYILPILNFNIPLIGSAGSVGIALGDSNLFNRAMEDLQANAQRVSLEGRSSQLYNVIAEKVVRSPFIVYGQVTLTLTADIIEFTGEYVDYASRSSR